MLTAQSLFYLYSQAQQKGRVYTYPLLVNLGFMQ